VRPEDTDAAVDRSLAELGVSPPPAKVDGAREGEAASLGWQLVQTLLTLGVVLGLVYLVLNVGLRKLMGGASLQAPGGGMVSVVARVPLEPRRTLYVLKAAGEYLLVSSSEAGVSLLSKLDPAEAERLQAAGQGPGAGLSPFLQKLLARRGSPPPEA
jgi:flagellar biogenesis protein FliO